MQEEENTFLVGARFLASTCPTPDAPFPPQQNNRPHASTSPKGQQVWPVVTVHDHSFLQFVIPADRMPVSRASVKKIIPPLPRAPKLAVALR